MSGVLEAWKSIHNHSRGPSVAFRSTTVPAAVSSISRDYSSLANRIFFSSGALRRRVLFVSVDAECNIANIGEQIARAVATKTSVGLVDSGMDSTGTTTGKKPAGSVRANGPWSDLQVADQLWKVPFQTLFEHEHPIEGRIEYSVPFERVVFTSQIYDSLTPLFCSSCDGAVLVLAAGRTRRDVAVNAKHTLHQLNIELLGSVLSNRTFPIPEFIYRRL